MENGHDHDAKEKPIVRDLECCVCGDEIGYVLTTAGDSWGKVYCHECFEQDVDGFEIGEED